VNRFGLRFHHFGLAVPDVVPALRYLDALGYRAGEPMLDPLQCVNLALCRHAEMPHVELVWPGAGPSPIDQLLKRRGPHVYHLCYSAPSAATAVAAIEADGFNVAVISEPKPAVLFGGRAVSFYNIAEFGVIELLDDGIPETVALRGDQHAGA
jgi:catechol 2,3-dioxygenase-like lactoylglutathione lyase family enzyme